MARPLTREAVASAGLRYAPVAPCRERTFSAQDGLSLFFRDYGDALSPRVSMLCLSGLTRNSKDFHGPAMHLSGGRRVICLDYRGRGRSDYDADWRNYRPAVYVNDIRHLLAVTATRRVVVIGTSLGGFLAMLLAVAVPGRLAGVVLNDIGPSVPREGLEKILAHIRSARPQPDWETARRHLREKLSWMSLGDEDAWTQFVENSFRQGADGRLHLDWDINLVRPLTRLRWPLPDLWPLFRALRHIPTLAIRGASSKVLSAETFERMAAEKPDLLRLTVADVGHAPTLQEPEVVEAVDDFLESIR
jgi:pimeloyl-ACP methyl ester carboxylesterase